MRQPLRTPCNLCYSLNAMDVSRRDLKVNIKALIQKAIVAFNLGAYSLKRAAITAFFILKNTLRRRLQGA